MLRNTFLKPAFETLSNNMLEFLLMDWNDSTCTTTKFFRFLFYLQEKQQLGKKFLRRLFVEFWLLNVQ